MKKKADSQATPKARAGKPAPKPPSPYRIRLIRRVLAAALSVLAVLVLALLAGTTWIAVRYNAETQAQQLIALVRQQTGYELTLAAPPHLTLTPSLGLALDSLALADPASRRVATAEHAHVAFDLWTLLRGQVQVRRAQFDGLTLWPDPAQRYVLPTAELRLKPANEAEAAKALAFNLDATLLDAEAQALPLHFQGTLSQGLPIHVQAQGLFDQTTVTLDATYTPSAPAEQRPALRFDISLGTLDLDRYRAHPLAQPVVRAASLAPVAAPAEGGLPWLRHLPADAQGTLRVASLQLMNVKLAHLRLQARAQEEVRDGPRDRATLEEEGQSRRKRRVLRLELNPLAASLYSGGLYGNVSAELDADNQPPRIAARLDLREVQMAPLLRDAFDAQWLEGRGNLALNVRGSGATLREFKRQLGGTVGLQLGQGAIALDVTGALKDALSQWKPLKNWLKPKASPAQPAADDARWRTPFTQLRASLQIRQGVAGNEDLVLLSPDLRIDGKGTAWLAEDRLEGTLRVTALDGLVIPVHLHGPYDQLQWRVAYANIAPTPQLKSKIQKQLERWSRDAGKALEMLQPGH